MNTQTMLASSIGLPSADFQSARKTLSFDHYPARARFILKMLAGLQHGALRLELPDGQSAHFGDDSSPITLRLHELSMFDAVLKSGDIGFAESYINGSWSTDDLTGLIALFIRNL